MITLRNDENRIRLSEAMKNAGIGNERAKLLIKSGSVIVGGRIKKRDVRLREGDHIEIDGVFPELVPSELVVYEDDNFFVMRKPYGMDCTTEKETGRDTLYAAARRYMEETGQYNTQVMSVPYICQRLDKGSAGLVMIAKNEEFFQLMMQAVRERRIKRILSAYIGAVPAESEGEISHYASKTAEDAKIIITDEAKKGYLPVITRYRVMESNMGVSIIEAVNLNGGVTLARAQLAFAGMPVIGDREYGDERINDRFTPEYPALAVEKFIFETGINNPLSYLNMRVIASEDELPELRMRRKKQAKN
ncbi:MAG: hypothetical protein IKM38_11030 [Christensenellaceae bacterium]|nr:hypothetical protein [Christensenellaceae bacterium]